MLEMDSGVFAREDNSREAVEEPEYKNLLGNLENSLSAKGLRGIAYAIIQSLVFWTGGLWWSYVWG